MTNDKKKALKTALAGVAAYILVPVLWLVMFGENTNGINELIGKNIIAGIFGFPFLYFFILKLNKHKNLNSKLHRQNLKNKQTVDRKQKISKVALIVGLFMLICLFLPQAINGTLLKQYYLGALFWIVVIVISANNLFGKK